MRYEVSTRAYGRKRITRDGPCQGLLEWPASVWTRITPRPVGLTRARALADAQATHATVQPWGAADVVYDNGVAAQVPAGWYPPTAVIA